MPSIPRHLSQFPIVHAVLALVTAILAVHWLNDPSFGGGSSVGSALAAAGVRMVAPAIVTFFAGLVTWAIVGRIGQQPPFGFGLRYLGLSILACAIPYLVLQAVSNWIVYVRFDIFIDVLEYVPAILIVVAGALAARGFGRAAGRSTVVAV